MSTAGSIVHLTCGRAKASIILDGDLDVDAAPMFKGFQRSDWAGTIGEVGDGRVTPNVSVLLVEVDGERMIFDAGMGQSSVPGRRGGGLFTALDRLGLSPAVIDRVVISHAHGDHIWGAVAEGAAGGLVPAFPRARYHVARLDWEWLQRQPENPGNRYLAPVAASGQLVLDEPDGPITASLRTIDTAGHSPGHRCLLIESDGQRLCFLGDLVHHPPLHFAYPERMTGFDYRPEMTPPARRRIAARAVAEGWQLVAAHGAFPPLGRVEPAGNDSWRWVATAGES